MSPESERLVRESWEQLDRDAPQLGAAFYTRLFEYAPGTRAMFVSTDMAVQQRKFADMLREIVLVLDDPERLVREVAASGRRHAGYGVEQAHYPIVGTALIGAIQQVLGPAATPAVCEAWREAYALLAAVMQRGARAAGASSATA